MKQGPGRRLIPRVCAVLFGFLFAVQPSGHPQTPHPRLYVADTGNSRIVRIDDMIGTGWVVLKSMDSRYEELIAPASVVVDAKGDIYIADPVENYIVRVQDMQGRIWTDFGLQGGGLLEFSAPTGIFVDEAGRIYVADTSNHRFFGPTGVFADRTRHIYVVDSGNDRIVRIDDLTGKGWVALGGKGGGTRQFRSPTSIYVDESAH